MKKLFIQAVKFLGISGIGWVLDFCIFNLLNLRSGDVAVNNMASSLAAVCFVFAASTRKTFVQKDGGLRMSVKFIIYILYQAALILLASKLLSTLHVYLAGIFAGIGAADFSAMAAKIMITPITMFMNFCVMKLLIERI